MSRENYKLYDNIYVRNAIHTVVAAEQLKISDFVRKIIHDKELSYRKVADKSGGLITHSTVSDVVNGRVTNLSAQTITGLAKGLGVTEQEIFDIVRGRNPDDLAVFDEGLARGMQRLSPSKQKLAKKQIASILESLADSEDDFDYGDFGDEK